MPRLVALLPLLFLLYGGTPILDDDDRTAVVFELKETIFVSGGRESQIVDDHDDDSILAEASVNNAAGTHDGSDASLDAISYTDGINAAASGHMGVIYTPTAATYTGPISFVRWRLRAGRTDLSGGPTGSQITPSKNAAAFASNFSILTLTTPLVSGSSNIRNLALDATRDPATGLPWTLARFNDGLKYGFQLDLDRASVSPGQGVECEVRCYEFWLELWGPK